MWKIYICTTADEYQKTVDDLQRDGWTIQMINRDPAGYVITASRPVNPTPSTIN